MSNTKIKVIWICHFTNMEIQKLLPLWKNKNEFASWIPNYIKGFENDETIELHIISPHEYLKQFTYFTKNNINYYFIPFGVPILHRHWPNCFNFDELTNYHFFRKKVKYIVKKLRPDVINLIGAENSYYSSSILDFIDDYPVLITIQGFISEFKNELSKNPKLKKRILFEEKILKSFKYYSGEQDSSTYISTYNPSHSFFRLYFPVNELLARQTESATKEYDCIYFGRLTKSKGAEDFIKVISELKMILPNIKACMVGGGNLKSLIDLSSELKCNENIEFKGFVKSQIELFAFVKSSKVFLAPPYNERLSSTIRETMLLKVPIVAYATGGIPYVNEFDENIYLVKTGDYKAMAQKTLSLITDKNRADKLAEKAYQYCIKEFSLQVNTQRLLDAYQLIIKENRNYYGL